MNHQHDPPTDSSADFPEATRAAVAAHLAELHERSGSSGRTNVTDDV